MLVQNLRIRLKKMNKNYLILSGLLLCAFVIFSALFTCCQTFKPIWIKELPSECNMSLNTYRMYFDSKDKSGSVPAFDYCIKKLHRQSCQAEVFGVDAIGKPNPVLYDDTKLYRNYSQCLQELK